MKYLIIYAHPNPKSFNHAIREQVEARLKVDKKEYAVRDLYELKFDPILKGDDFVLFKQGKVAEDIQREQDYIRKAETLIFIYPIWWFSMPAILKGYIDRVFSYGFAYDVGEKGLRGLLPDKKVMLFNTTGGPEQNYQSVGFTEALKKTTEVGVFELCAMKVLLHKYFYAVPTVDDGARKKMLDEIKTLSF